MRFKFFANAKAWFNDDIMVEWPKYNFPYNLSPVLLLLDEFTGHKTKALAYIAKKLNVEILEIPRGLISKAQPADVNWN
jgi:hypothetical protein